MTRLIPWNNSSPRQRIRKSRSRYQVLLLVLLFAEAAAADLFTGEFSGTLDGKAYQLSISGFARGQYEGELRSGGETLPLNARRFGDRIAGQIGVADLSFGFLAQLQGGGLLLQYEDGKVIFFKRGRIKPEVSVD